jgi:hypothetical protein
VYVETGLSVRSRAMSTRMLLVTAALVAVLTLPGVATAQDGLSPLAPVQTQPQPAPSTPTGDDGLSSTQQLLIACAGLVLLFGIGWAIVRDAHRRAPVDDRRTTADGSAPLKGTKATPSHRTSKSHKKAKAARRARKRNR